MFLTRSLHDFCSPYITSFDPQGGFSLIKAMQVHAAPTGRVFGPFWSENEYKFCPFWFGIGMVFYQFQMSKKEREICELEMDLHFSYFSFNLSNDDIISA